MCSVRTKVGREEESGEGAGNRMEAQSFRINLLIRDDKEMAMACGRRGQSGLWGEGLNWSRNFCLIKWAKKFKSQSQSAIKMICDVLSRAASLGWVRWVRQGNRRERVGERERSERVSHNALLIRTVDSSWHWKQQFVRCSVPARSLFFISFRVFTYAAPNGNNKVRIVSD